MANRLLSQLRDAIQHGLHVLGRDAVGGRKHPAEKVGPAVDGLEPDERVSRRLHARLDAWRHRVQRVIMRQRAEARRASAPPPG